jgi:hypothetical protein
MCNVGRTLRVETLPRASSQDGQMKWGGEQREKAMWMTAILARAASIQNNSAMTTILANKIPADVVEFEVVRPRPESFLDSIS